MRNTSVMMGVVAGVFFIFPTTTIYGTNPFKKCGIIALVEICQTKGGQM